MFTQMTNGEWRSLGVTMVWSIYDKDSYAAFDKLDHANHEDFCRAHDAILLDLRAPEGTPDGEHLLVCHLYPKEGKARGVTVKDGHFVPKPTEAAVLRAVCESDGADARKVKAGKERIDHVYIEVWLWDEERQALIVQTGS